MLTLILLQELMEEDSRKAKRYADNNTNLVTGEPLIFKNESVEDFLKRTSK